MLLFRFRNSNPVSRGHSFKTWRPEAVCFDRRSLVFCLFLLVLWLFTSGFYCSFNMPGANCSIYGCTVSRRQKYQGISLFKVPGGKNEFDTAWRSKLVNIITKDRVIDAALRKQIEKNSLYICERHFSEDQYYKHDSKATLNPGVLPTLNLPIKSHPSTSSSSASTVRASAQQIQKKKDCLPLEPSQPVNVTCYKSYDEFKVKTNKLKLPGWQMTDHSNFMTFFHYDSVHSVPKFEIYVDEQLNFRARCYLWSLPATHDVYTNFQKSVKNITISNLMNIVSSYGFCPGLSHEFSAACTQHSVPKVFNLDMNESSAATLLHESKWFRSPSCLLLISNELSRCQLCDAAEKKELLSLKRKSNNLMSPAKLKAPISLTSPERIVLTMQNLRQENKQLQEQLETIRAELETKTIPVANHLGDDLIQIMNNTDSNKIPPFMKMFWEEQQKYISSSRKGVRYHPMIIRYCLGLAAKSAAVYDQIRYDEKTQSGFLILPSRRRLRDYKNYIRPQHGFNPKVVEELRNLVANFSEVEKYCILLMDEMKIQENLVWDKHTGDLIGFVDLGDVELNYATLQKHDEIASHVLVFLVRSIVNPLKFSLANFATCNATSVQMFPLFWKAVGVLEDGVGMKVIGATADGASTNRSLFRMHFHMLRPEDINVDVDVVYRTLNIMADDEERYLYFFSDSPHLMKTARNCLANSLAGRCTRSMWNDGKYLSWNDISKLFYDDIDCGLYITPKLTNDHISLTPFSVMNVKLAVQVLSNSVSKALRLYGPPEALGTSIYCEMFDNFFDCTNVRNNEEWKKKSKDFLKPYTDVNDARFLWLTDTFLQYFSDWKQSIQQRPGQFTDNAKANMFLSWQTYEGVKITVYSLIDAVKFLLNHDVQYVLTERFCQDPLENYFGRQRSMGHRKDNPSLRDFGYNDNTIRTAKIFRPIAGNCRDDPELMKINVDSVPCRPRNKKQ